MNINSQQIETLRTAFGALNRMDPDGKTYRQLCNLLDRADDDALKAVYEAKIKFVSLLAYNRMIRHQRIRP